MANFLVTRGAKKLVLVSSSGVSSGFQSLFIRRWNEKNVQVVIVDYDSAKPAEAEKLLVEANKLGPVAGIFQLEAVAHTTTASDLSASDFQLVFNQKAESTINLDTASRKLCPQLEHFFVWSSGASGHGTAFNANYGYTDAALTRISEARQAAGYPSVNSVYFRFGGVALYTRRGRDKQCDFKISDRCRMGSHRRCRPIVGRA